MGTKLRHSRVSEKWYGRAVRARKKKSTAEQVRTKKKINAQQGKRKMAWQGSVS